jgi:hypothetical protein
MIAYFWKRSYYFSQGRETRIGNDLINHSNWLLTVASLEILLTFY